MEDNYREIKKKIKRCNRLLLLLKRSLFFFGTLVQNNDVWLSSADA